MTIIHANGQINLFQLLALLLFPALIGAPAFALQGDLNCDGQVSFKDINPFVLRLSAPETYAQQYPTCPPLNGDMNGDGEVTFQDINRFVNAIVACAANTAPEAVALASPLEVPPGEPVDFDGSGSLDLQNNIESYSWNFADGSPPAQGEIVSHASSAPGTYLVSLSVADACGSLDSDSLTIVVQSSQAECQVSADCSSRCAQHFSCIAGQCVENENAQLCADFRLEQLVQVDIDGSEHWRILEGEPVEYGLRVRLNAGVSTGNPAWIFWDFGDGTFGSNEIELHQFYQQRDVNIDIYDETFTEFDDVTKPVTVTPGIQRLSGTMFPGHEFWPTRVGVSGNELWAISANLSLGLTDISNPNNLGAWTILLPQGSMMDVTQMAVSGSKLFLSKNYTGIEAYHKQPFTPAQGVSMPELNNSNVSMLAARGDYLYAGTWEGRLYSFLTSGENPQYLSHLSLGSLTAKGAITPDGTQMAVITDDDKLRLFSLANPGAPQQIGDAVQLPNVLQHALTVSNTLAVFRTGSEITAVARLADFGITTPDLQNIPYGGPAIAATGDRVYFADSSANRIKKFDVTNRFEEAYLIQSFHAVQDALVTKPFIHDLDGSGPAETVLMVGSNPVGYAAYIP